MSDELVPPPDDTEWLETEEIGSTVPNLFARTLNRFMWAMNDDARGFALSILMIGTIVYAFVSH
jgi:hypothetical protein